MLWKLWEIYLSIDLFKNSGKIRATEKPKGETGMELAAALKALADENRLLIVRLLGRRDYCVRALARQLGVSQAAVSQHLKVLREAGLVSGEKRGYFLHYRVEGKALRTVSSALAALAREAPAPCGGCSRDGGPGCGRVSADTLAEHWEVNTMKIAVTYENGQIFQHFGHCGQFKLYDVENGAVLSSQVVSAAGSGHGALAGFLQGLGADYLICGGIGGGARTALAQANIRLYPGVTGDADQAVADLLAGKLEYDPDTVCSHHHEGGHDCHGGCGEDKHGCHGSC